MSASLRAPLLWSCYPSLTGCESKQQHWGLILPRGWAALRHMRAAMRCLQSSHQTRGRCRTLMQHARCSLKLCLRVCSCCGWDNKYEQEKKRKERRQYARQAVAIYGRGLDDEDCVQCARQTMTIAEGRQWSRASDEYGWRVLRFIATRFVSHDRLYRHDSFRAGGRQHEVLHRVSAIYRFFTGNSWHPSTPFRGSKCLFDRYLPIVG